ncbi:MAG: hypothetical protein ACE5OZ_18805 [Candidatus Heimdallarchaeota archaeon]
MTKKKMKWRTSEEFQAQLSQHPAFRTDTSLEKPDVNERTAKVTTIVKNLAGANWRKTAKFRKKKRIKRPKKTKLSEAEIETHLKIAITGLKQVMDYHRKVGTLLEQKLQGTATAPEYDADLIAEGMEAEISFQDMITSAIVVLQADSRFKAYTTAIVDELEDLHIFANPAFLPPEEVKLVEALGITGRELIDYYGYFTLPLLPRVKEVLTTEGELDKLFDKILTFGPRLPFAEAPRYLEAQGVITLGGDGSVVSVVVAAVVTVVAAVVIAPVVAAGVAVGLAVAGVIKLGEFIEDKIEEAYGNAQETIDEIEDTAEDAIDDAIDDVIDYFDDTIDGISYSQWVTQTKTQTPAQKIQYFGYALGNMSSSKKELHAPSCSFLHLIHPRHLRTFASIEEGHAANLDNCHYCIGDSER